MASYRQSRIRRRTAGSSYQQNIGVPGVVYVLENPGLAAGILKIGCSRRSGYARAQDLNQDASTGTPGTFRCVFECRTVDCGTAERRVFQQLSYARRGKWGQEYFEVELEQAKDMISRACSSVDSEHVQQVPAVTPLRPTHEGAQQSPPRPNAEVIAPARATRQSSTFSLPGYFGLKKLLWVVAGLLFLGNWLTSTKPSKQPSQILQAFEPTIKQSSRITQKPVESSPHSIQASPKAVTNEKPGQAVSARPLSSPDSNQNDPNSLGRDLASLSRDEKQSLDAVCLHAKVSEGPAALNDCREKHLRTLSYGTPAPDLSRLSMGERQSIEAVCVRDKYQNGPAAYDRCLHKHFVSLIAGPREPDLSGLTRDERQSIEAVCMRDKYQNGPVAYAYCLQKQIATLAAGPREPDTSGLTREERQSIDMVCMSAKYRGGPMAHNQCVIVQLAKLHR